MSAELLRIYAPEECGADGYPSAWHHDSFLYAGGPRMRPIKDLIREEAGHRCIRCGHPYPPGIAEEHPRGEWTPCDEECDHDGPMRMRHETDAPEAWSQEYNGGADARALLGGDIPLLVQARWRILTVHHLNGVKYDCRWWNLAALCQRCHLTIQGRVVMDRIYPLEHSEWFKPHAAGWYAADYLGEDLTKEETMARLDELLALERSA